MQRKPLIRISANDKKEYAKLVRNAKAKVKRIKKNYGIDLSQEINIPDLNTIKYREDFNKTKEKLSSFTNRFNLHYQFRKNPKGTVASVAEIQKGQRLSKAAQNRARKLHESVKDLPFYAGGQNVGKVSQRLGMVRRPEVSGIPIPPDFNFNTIPSRRVLLDRLNSLEEKTTGEFYEKAFSNKKQQYIDLMYAAFNSDADPLVKKLRAMTDKDFMELYYTYDVFDFNKYDSDRDNQININNKDNIDMMIEYIDNFAPSDLSGF